MQVNEVKNLQNSKFDLQTILNVFNWFVKKD